MQTPSIPLTVMLCGAAVMMVSGALARLQVSAPGLTMAYDRAFGEEAFDGELEGEAPSLTGEALVAAPGLDDRYFGGTVIYLLSHDESGALGLVLNRPGGLLLGAEDVRRPLAQGGPVAQGRVIALHADPRRGAEVEPGIYAAADPAIVDDILRGATHGRVFAGYAGWGPGQLERELSEGAWLVREAAADDVLGARPPADCPTPY